MDVDVEEWASGARPALRGLIEDLGGDVRAFDIDPLAGLPILDDFVSRMPWAEFEEDDWVWIHSMLTAFVAEILIRCHGGRWKAEPDPSGPTGWTPVIEAIGSDRGSRQVRPMALVHQYLHPVPQRLPALVERAIALAGHGPAA